MTYIGRFAPSPTGPLHAGSLVAALASWLDARAHGGCWLVRIEDVDATRCHADLPRRIMRQLLQHALVPDAEPAVQSQRHAQYQQALNQLIGRSLAYPCTCSRKQIAGHWAGHGQSPQRHGERVYPGTCRPQRGAAPAPVPAQPHAWRLDIAACLQRQGLPADAATVWNDRRLGAQQQVVTQAVGDFVLRRADGLWAYQLAVVVDDADQGVTHVVRGEDLADNTARNAALLGMADALCSVDDQAAILAANAEDMAAAKGHISDVMLDRLALTAPRIEAMAQGIREVAALPDPVGRVLNRVERPNGLVIEKTAVPMGVIAIIYESRPNVTSDAAALAIKSGNACILRCGKEAWRSANAIVTVLRQGLKKAGLPETAVCLIEDTTHASANALMTAVGYVDLLIPRGGAGLIRACVQNAKVPCIQTGTGICHIFVDASAEQDKALDIIENAKASRPSVCNAEEVCLVHRDIAAEFLPKLARRLGPDRTAKGLHPVELRLDPRAAAIIPGTPAGPADFDTEFLDYILAVKVVDSVEEAVSHIAAHSTGHSEAILTRDEAHAALFTAAVDSAAVYVNCSTRFTDGGEFGLGCEMGISTQKLHARGPMGLEELCSYKYIIHGSGQIR